MKILDANILIYAVNRDAELHERTKQWLTRALVDDETIGFPWQVVLAFLRISTRPGLFRTPLRPGDAMDIMDQWLTNPSAKIIEPGPLHLSILRQLLTTLGVGGNMASDAHLAALAIENRADLWSFDTDFARFPNLRWRNPLATLKTK